MMYPLLLVCGAVLLFVYILEKIRAYSVKAVIIKSVVSVLFITVGVYGSWRCAVNGIVSLLCPFVVLGLLLGLLGDIWLDLKYVFPEKDGSSLLRAQGSFLCLPLHQGVRHDFR